MKYQLIGICSKCEAEIRRPFVVVHTIVECDNCGTKHQIEYNTTPTKERG